MMKNDPKKIKKTNKKIKIYYAVQIQFLLSSAFVNLKFVARPTQNASDVVCLTDDFNLIFWIFSSCTPICTWSEIQCVPFVNGFFFVSQMNCR